VNNSPIPPRRSETITVVIPVLNDSAMLEDALKGLALQTRSADEILVVDNNCTDDSPEVARRYGARVVREHRPGITAASSRGFDEARGTIIARCDADTRMPAGWLRRIEADLALNPAAVAVTGPARFYDLHGLPHLLARLIYIKGYFAVMRPILGHEVLYASNCAMRAAAWRAVSASIPRDDTEIHDDFDLSFRLGRTARVVYDRHLVVEVSGRPFDSGRVMARRLTRAWHTMRLHLPWRAEGTTPGVHERTSEWEASEHPAAPTSASRRAPATPATGAPAAGVLQGDLSGGDRR
jgi:glycosyltransferase involved in cell wall biosynthesis